MTVPRLDADMIVEDLESVNLVHQPIRADIANQR